MPFNVLHISITSEPPTYHNSHINETINTRDILGDKINLYFSWVTGKQRHKKICVKIEGGLKNNHNSNERSEESSKPLLLLSTGHDSNVYDVFIYIFIYQSVHSVRVLWGMSWICEESTPPHPSARPSVCRCTACYLRLHSTSAKNRKRKKETEEIFNALLTWCP